MTGFQTCMFGEAEHAGLARANKREKIEADQGASKSLSWAR
jgi:hypothetical protein